MVTRILLSNIGGLDNPGIRMMIKAITENIDADFYYHKLTVCKGYEAENIKGSWKPYGYDVALDLRRGYLHHILWSISIHSSYNSSTTHDPNRSKIHFICSNI